MKKYILTILLIFSLFFSIYSQEHPGKKVLIDTDMGPIVILLYDETPLHQANFIKLCEEGF